MGMWLEKVVKAESGHRGSQKVNGIRDLLKLAPTGYFAGSGKIATAFCLKAEYCKFRKFLRELNFRLYSQIHCLAKIKFFANNEIL